MTSGPKPTDARKTDSHHPSAWFLAEKLAARIGVEHGSDVATLVRLGPDELRRRESILDGNETGFRTVSRRKEAGAGLKTFEKA